MSVLGSVLARSDSFGAGVAGDEDANGMCCVDMDSDRCVGHDVALDHAVHRVAPDLYPGVVQKLRRASSVLFLKATGKGLDGSCRPVVNPLPPTLLFRTTTQWFNGPW